MIVEESSNRIKTQNLYDDLEVKIIHCIHKCVKTKLLSD